jgi:NAD(P)-dependent dehydrogenase (short-subunit alcohol dehydrogenase family)
MSPIGEQAAMARRFDNSVVLVTGGGTGIGRAIATSFAAEGAMVYVAGRREAVLHEVAREITGRGERALPVRADVSKGADVASLIDLIRRRDGRLNVLVNAAGAFSMGLVHESSEEDFDLMFNTNVKGLWLVSKLAVPLLTGQPNANIIHLSSIAGTRFDPGIGLYEASKAAVNSLTKVMAKELAPHKIRVNAIAPGPVDTKLFSGDPLGTDVEKRESGTTAIHLSEPVPFGRLGTPEEVARLALFLASPESDFISGSITSIDGAMGY